MTRCLTAFLQGLLAREPDYTVRHSRCHSAGVWTLIGLVVGGSALMLVGIGVFVGAGWKG